MRLHRHPENPLRSSNSVIFLPKKQALTPISAKKITIFGGADLLQRLFSRHYTVV
jgi:hypothetical protein